MDLTVEKRIFTSKFKIKQKISNVVCLVDTKFVLNRPSVLCIQIHT